MLVINYSECPFSKAPMGGGAIHPFQNQRVGFKDNAAWFFCAIGVVYSTTKWGVTLREISESCGVGTSRQHDDAL